MYFDFLFAWKWQKENFFEYLCFYIHFAHDMRMKFNLCFISWSICKSVRNNRTIQGFSQSHWSLYGVFLGSQWGKSLWILPRIMKSLHWRPWFGHVGNLCQELDRKTIVYVVYRWKKRVKLTRAVIAIWSLKNQ